MGKELLLLVNSKVLPPVFESVVYAKELLANGEVKNVTEATKKAGISRSAFYKYKDSVSKFEGAKTDIITIEAVLSDKAGVFSLMTKILYENGANIITVNQNAPKNGYALVSLTAYADNNLSEDKLLNELKQASGIKTVKIIQ